MTPVSFNLLHHFFHILHRIAIGNQHRIFGLYNHQVFHPDGRHQARLRINVAVFRFMANDVAVMHVSLGGVRADFPQ